MLSLIPLISSSHLTLLRHLPFSPNNFSQCYFCPHTLSELSSTARSVGFCDSQVTPLMAFTLLKCPLLPTVYLPSRSSVLHGFLDSHFCLHYMTWHRHCMPLIMTKPVSGCDRSFFSDQRGPSYIHSLLPPSFLSLIEIQCCNFKSILKRGKKSCRFGFGFLSCQRKD